MPTNHEQDLLVVHNILDEDFSVLWGGHPFMIMKGEEKIFPRFIAEHMAKHMADRYLLIQEDKDGSKFSYLNDRVRRPKVVAEILPRVFQEYLSQAQPSEQEKLNRQIEDVNNAVNLGAIPDKAIGVLKDTPTDTPSVKPSVSETDVSVIDPKKAKPTKAQLIDDCEKLGIELDGKETYDQLVEKIKKF